MTHRSSARRLLAETPVQRHGSAYLLREAELEAQLEAEAEAESRAFDAYLDRILGPPARAVLSRSGRTLSFACPFCGGRHRHHARRGDVPGAATSRESHCRVLNRLHPAYASARRHRRSGGGAAATATVRLNGSS